MRAKVADLAREHDFFHWHLEFPDVFGQEGTSLDDDQGGFDVILGNPPWERIKLQEKEFFANRDEAIANAPTAAKRRQLIKTLPFRNSRGKTANGKTANGTHPAHPRAFGEFSGLTPRMHGDARGVLSLSCLFCRVPRQFLKTLKTLPKRDVKLYRDYQQALHFSEALSGFLRRTSLGKNRASARYSLHHLYECPH